MRPNEYQYLASRTDSMLNADRATRIEHSLIGIGTESGEILNALKRHKFYGKPLDEKNILEEYGDLLWYIAIGLHAMDVSLEDVMIANIAKLKARYGDKFNMTGVDNRDYAKEAAAVEITFKKSPGEF